MKAKFTAELDYKGGVAKSCIHCHQIGDAAKTLARTRGTLPDDVLFPYPHPKALGLILDPKEKATVLRVEPRSPAAASGFRPATRSRSWIASRSCRWPTCSGSCTAAHRGRRRSRPTWYVAAYRPN